ncbi:hypothetical protein [Phormidesmis sp. 146-20]
MVFYFKQQTSDSETASEMIGKFFAIALAIFCMLPLQSCSPAQAQAGLDSRVSRLETDFFGLQSRLSQIESRIPRSSVAPSLPSNPVPQSRPRVASADPQFDRLATLVIELKERVTQLEKRLAKIDRQ